MKNAYRLAPAAGVLLAALVAAACQDSRFDYQPPYKYEAVHLTFDVKTPSKADLLFVVDNSGSMLPHQTALRNSVYGLLRQLAAKNTDYRVGITSTDTVEKFRYQNCDSNSDCTAILGSGWICKTNCPDLVPRCVEVVPINLSPDASSDANTDEPLCVSLVHDGNQGRLIAVNTNSQVIDRKAIAKEVGDARAETEVMRRFSENLFGVGRLGSGYEQGMKAGALAVGIDPDDQVDPLNPAYDTTLAGDAQQAGPNTYPNENDQLVSWVRPDAMLVVIFLSDEDDCSYKEADANSVFLSDASQGWEAGSSCYRRRDLLRDTSEFMSLFVKKREQTRTGTTVKGESLLAFGFIGGTAPATVFSDTPGVPPTEGLPSDCRSSSNGPQDQCACFEPQYSTGGMCSLTTLFPSSLGDPGSFDCPTECCQSMGGFRYYDLVTRLVRHRLDSICQDDFSAALIAIADIATLPCFTLSNVQPACMDPTRVTDFISVERNKAPLPFVDPGSDTVGWYFLPQTNQVCLNGIDRLIDDHYDIYVEVTTDTGHQHGCVD